MSENFRGFEPVKEEQAESGQEAENFLSELEEYESQDSRETSPSKRKADRGDKVRQLVQYFSQSDSDSSETTDRPTRSRRRSRDSEHQELPPGGERELKRRMAAQEAANNVLRVYEASMEDLNTSLGEAQSALDANKPRAALRAELEGILEVSEITWNTYEKVMANKSIEHVVLSFVDIEIKNNKFKTRVKKMVGHLRAATEEVTHTPGAVQITNPMSFGELKLPEFSGDYTEFEPFEGNFRKLIQNGGLDDGKKKAYLLKCLNGEAKSYIGTDGTAAKEYEDIWDELRQRYGKAWRVTRAAVQKMMDIQRPTGKSKDIVRYWNEIMETCKTAERLKLTASSLILNMALLEMPSEYRSKMDDKLKPISNNYVLTRQMVMEPFNDVIAIEPEKQDNIIATLGFNTSVGTSSKKIQNPSFPPRSGARGGIRKRFCILCDRKVDHLAAKCTVYPTATQARSRLSQLRRCIRCATLREEHGPMCSHRAVCEAHQGERHHYWLCEDGGKRGSGSHIGGKQQRPQQHHHWNANGYNSQPSA